MKPTELVTRLTTRIAEIKAKQETALAASQADGLSDADKKKHLDEFDRLQQERAAAQGDLARAEQMVRDDAADARRAAEYDALLKVTPEKPPIVQKVFVPPELSAGTGRVIVPATAKRFGQLKAFKGPNAEAEAYAFGVWVAATMYGNAACKAKLADLGLNPQSAMSSVSNGSGGYFVPDQTTTAILKLQEEYGVARRVARIVPMSSETWSGPRWAQNMVAYWVSQGNAPGESQPGWDKTELVAKDLAAFGKMTAQVNEDALIDLGDE